jgi:hypothetical protein
MLPLRNVGQNSRAEAQQHTSYNTADRCCAKFQNASIGPRLVLSTQVQITGYKLAPARGRPDGATWAPWAERLVPFSAEVNDSSKAPLRSEDINDAPSITRWHMCFVLCIARFESYKKRTTTWSQHEAQGVLSLLILTN